MIQIIDFSEHEYKQGVCDLLTKLAGTDVGSTVFSDALVEVAEFVLGDLGEKWAPEILHTLLVKAFVAQKNWERYGGSRYHVLLKYAMEPIWGYMIEVQRWLLR